MLVAYRPYYSALLRNEAFNLDHPMNMNGALERWAALKSYLAYRGIEFNTHDCYPDPREVDIWMMGELTKEMVRFVLKNRVDPATALFVMTEPPVVLPWGWAYSREVGRAFGGILTWNTDLCLESKRFMHYHFPVRIDPARYPFYRSRPKQNLCLMMHSNKHSRISGELYSLRRDIIRYFTDRGDHLLDLFGHGWNTAQPPSGAEPFFSDLYRGVSPDKLGTFSNYWFTFCIDNSVVPGYITYDPLLAMATGTVPIYLPMPDSARYIPENTFVNLDHFESLNDLVSYIQSIVETDRYGQYVQDGWDFIRSKEFHPFTIERFCEDVFRAINVVAEGSSTI